VRIKKRKADHLVERANLVLLAPLSNPLLHFELRKSNGVRSSGW